MPPRDTDTNLASLEATPWRHDDYSGLRTRTASVATRAFKATRGTFEVTVTCTDGIGATLTTPVGIPAVRALGEGLPFEVGGVAHTLQRPRWAWRYRHRLLLVTGPAVNLQLAPGSVLSYIITAGDTVVLDRAGRHVAVHSGASTEVAAAALALHFSGLAYTLSLIWCAAQAL